MVLIGALRMLAAISTARREYLQRALDEARAEQALDAAAARADRFPARLDGADGAFELRVLDDGAGLAAGPDGAREGVGLTNSRERLRHQFGTRAELLLTPRTDGPGTEVRLRVHP